MKRKDEAYGGLRPCHSSHGVLLITLVVALCWPAHGWSAATTVDGSWIAISPSIERSGHTAIYDLVRERVLLFGGYDSGSHNDVMAVSFGGIHPSWSLLNPAGSPPIARYHHTAIYDPVRDRMLVFGGYDDYGGYHNDVWALSLGGAPVWSEITPAGIPPPARARHTAIYDPVRDRMVVCGGANGSGVRTDAWALSLGESPSWIELAPTGVSGALWGQSAIYDPIRDRMVVFGGAGGSSLANGVWALSLAGSTAWSNIPPASGTQPSPRLGHTAIYDALSDRMLVFGGFNNDVNMPRHFNDVWALPLAGSPMWSEITTPAEPRPSVRKWHTAIYVPGYGMVVFGGSDQYSTILSDLWALSVGSPAWTELAPHARYGHSAIYDSVRDRMVVFGGTHRDIYTVSNDVWGLPLGGSPSWSRITPVGTPPAARERHSAIYDPMRNRMLVFGGWNNAGTRFNDVWALSLSGNPAWSQLTPSGPLPSARSGHTAIYDPVRDRMLVFGGGDDTNVLADVWALSLSGNPAWSQLTPSGDPLLPYLHPPTAIYDPIRDRMVVYLALYFDWGQDEVLALSLAGSPIWSVLVPPRAEPVWDGYEHQSIYDPVRDRMVIFGADPGLAGLSLSEGNPAWNALHPLGTWPSERSGYTMIYDSVRDRMLVFGGGPTDVVALEWGTPVSVPADDHLRPTSLALATPRPNPSRGPVTLDFTLPQAEHVSLVLYDAAGRKVRELVDGSLSAGRHSIYWDGRDRSGRTVAAGIYLVRLARPGAQVVRKAVISEAGSR